MLVGELPRTSRKFSSAGVYGDARGVAWEDFADIEDSGRVRKRLLRHFQANGGSTMRLRLTGADLLLHKATERGSVACQRTAVAVLVGICMSEEVATS